MNSPAATNTHALSNDTQNMVEKINGLGTDEKLALLYFVYEKMGESITPAAPAAAEPELAPVLLNDFYNLSHDQQLNIMRGIVNRDDTPYSHAYGALTANNQLLVWYAWAIDMGDKIVDIPEGYEATEAVNGVLGQIEGLEFEQQISVLRDVANNMGYTDVKPIATQAQVGKTSSL
ncbi:MAG: orange carotenoid protein [Microcoleus sp. PH2017_10_PVI_O_A]|uniref:orange carotenoid protein N-terminal domain-containing protein n=1 Tax=unclassified Microcoleus TaxID=2642155 RepID=UPI001D89B010|nr:MULTISPECIES: orange carotenoid protein N-terminal domain-containing protein [unclassified Microcoleus]TAF23738.1 MAG: orange carotenoid protein [Oscillatoriales cyanobacterium]MCC3404332.1 orange carotenoid protein [Microcoleus sp. PH2017_10_PVI_O_A]MCC3458421.1 orange carotenoid protein [Microcoleus sp. PH2017_11_PCY_U_A]MCC3476759.1 orange carotenoid protein [Microcoleus sp. PH2017_12_PCY_D_A]MCC3526898.1 orange carotenoid protein [Microcoleus sp. PH2017_21_RUC_O_A]